MKLRCDNCDATYADVSELASVFPDIPDLLARIEPGGTVPDGECPNCGCLVYEEHEASPMRIVIVLEGALVQQVLADAPGCTYAIIDRDTDGVEPDRLRHDPADHRACTIETGEAEADPEYVAASFRAAGTDAVPPGPAPDPMAVLKVLERA
jgi:hypothetical protein